MNPDSMRNLFGKTWLLFLLCMYGMTNAQNVHYVSPSGQSSNVGTLANPWSLNFALNGAQAAGKVQPGDTIYLLSGSYIGNFTSNLGFADGLPIIVTNYKAQRATIDGNTGASEEKTALTINGLNTWFVGLEITSTYTQRIASGIPGGNGTYPEKIFICYGVEVFGKDIKVINCIIHDMTSTGLSSWKYSDNNEVYGCIIYNNGFFNLSDSNGITSERGNGPGLYLQHLEASKPKVLRNNFVFKNFSNGIQAKTVVTVPGHALNGIYLDSNTIFNSGALNYNDIARKYNLYLGTEIYAANPAENIYVTGNVFYRDETDGSAPYVSKQDMQWKPAWYHQSNISFGTGQIDSFLHFRSNHVVGSSYAGDVYVRNRFGHFDFQNNTLYDPIGKGALVGVEYFSTYNPTDTVRLLGSWNNNRYFSKNHEPFWRFKALQQLDKALPVAGFQAAMKVDLNSTHQEEMLPADTAFIRPNKYEPNTFFVTVLNHSKQATFSLQLQSPALIGLQYIVTDIQNYYGQQVASGVYNGNNIMLPMNLTEVSIPVGAVPQQPLHSSAGLGTFLIRFYNNLPGILSCNPPSGLVVKSTPTVSAVKLEWTAADGAVRYIIQKKNDANWDSIGSTTNTNFIVSNVQRFATNSFRVGTRCVADTGLRFSNIATSPGKYFVSSDGNATNMGDYENPWSLAYAFAGADGLIKAGDSVFIKGGIYKGDFTASFLIGNETQPIVFTNYNGARAIIDGYVANNNLPAISINASCSFVYLSGLEITSSSTARLSTTEGDIYTGKGVFIQGHGIKMINCIVHDMPGDGIFMERTASETEVYGCLIYNNGFERASVAYGNGISLQNTDEDRPKEIKNSFIFKNNTTGIFAYGSTAALSVNGINIDSSIIFNTGAMLTNTLARKYNLLIGGASSNFPAESIRVFNNVIYRDETDGAGSDKPHNLRYNICLGQSGITDSSIVLQRNQLIGGGFYGAIYVQSNFLGYNLQNNTFYTPDVNNKLLVIKSGVSLPPIWNNNKYYSANAAAFSGTNWDTWKTTYNTDGASLYNVTKPTDTFLLSRNKYVWNTYYVTVLNHSKSASFRLPFVNSALAGGSFVVTDAQDYFGGIVASGSYNGSYIDLPMSNKSVSAPVGTIATQPKHTSAGLGTFIIKISDQPLYCPGSTISFTADIAGAAYHWQVNEGNGFVNIGDGSNYAGSKTSTLQLINMPYQWSNNQYRCVVDGNNSSVFLVKFAPSTWNGSVSNAWENPANWDCGLVPSPASDVIINSGNVFLQSNVKCSTLTLKNNAVLTIKPSYSLTLDK